MAVGSIVGSWYASNPGGGTDQICYSFLADGTFLVATKGTSSREPSGFNGLEYGTYTWDSLSSTLNLVFTVNTDGTWGLSDGNITGAQVQGDILTLTGDNDPVLVPRLLTSPGSIVGSWFSAQTTGGSEKLVFTFLADGTYLLADKGSHAKDPTGDSGMEWGTYAWDPASGALAVQTLANTDGQWGFSDAHGDIPNLVVSGDTLLANGVPFAVRMSPYANIVAGTAANDSLAGTIYNDSIYGFGGNDSFTGAYGNDTADGGPGIDTAMYLQQRFNYTLAKTDTGFTVTDKNPEEGIDTLLDVERLHFIDKNVALDLSGNAGMVAKILGAVFDGPSVTNRAYVGIGLSYADGGMGYDALMQLALNVRLGAVHSHNDVVTLLYGNVVGGAMTPSTIAGYVALLDNGSYTEAQLGILAAETTFNATQIGLNTLILQGLEYT
ncbi:hypothetical protein [Caenimonas aquaedulcis]|uniref:DUF4214 domain-containing protein n=1 Tax=Caenimonas aquaedulcis TaxID=2793270 RepID=A0A931MHC8_9BURK|nr:hypothetical protein [Caenimonas aquaedulcis]MBG9388609.1 hypothetical protein [Caenimonas aquaedulcis]